MCRLKVHKSDKLHTKAEVIMGHASVKEDASHRNTEIPLASVRFYRQDSMGFVLGFSFHLIFHALCLKRTAESMLSTMNNTLSLIPGTA